jgi:hypothetical protein
MPAVISAWLTDSLIVNSHASFPSGVATGINGMQAVYVSESAGGAGGGTHVKRLYLQPSSTARPNPTPERQIDFLVS